MEDDDNRRRRRRHHHKRRRTRDATLEHDVNKAMEKHQRRKQQAELAQTAADATNAAAAVSAASQPATLLHPSFTTTHRILSKKWPNPSVKREQPDMVRDLMTSNPLDILGIQTPHEQLTALNRMSTDLVETHVRKGEFKLDENTFADAFCNDMLVIRKHFPHLQQHYADRPTTPAGWDPFVEVATYDHYEQLQYAVGPRPSPITGKTIDPPGCARKEQCVGRLKSIDDLKMKHPDGFQYMAYHSKEELRLLYTEGLRIQDENRLCYMCYRVVILPIYQNIMRPVDARGNRGVLHPSWLIQMFAHMTDKPGGYKSEYCLYPSDRGFNGLWHPLLMFRSDMILAEQDEHGHWHTTERRLIWKPPVHESDFQRGAINGASARMDMTLIRDAGCSNTIMMRQI